MHSACGEHAPSDRNNGRTRPQARSHMRVAVTFPSHGFYGAREDPARRSIAECFIPHAQHISQPDGLMLAAPDNAAHRTSRRFLQSGPSRSPAHLPCCDEAAGAGRGVVAGLSRQSTQDRGRNGSLPRSAPVRAPGCTAFGNPRQRFRRIGRNPVHHRHDFQAEAPLSRGSLHLADGRRYPAAVSPMAKLAETSRHGPDCGVPPPGL